MSHFLVRWSVGPSDRPSVHLSHITLMAFFHFLHWWTLENAMEEGSRFSDSQTEKTANFHWFSDLDFCFFTVFFYHLFAAFFFLNCNNAIENVHVQKILPIIWKISKPVYSCIFPPPGSGGIKSKDLEMGKAIKGRKIEKMKNTEDFTLLTVLICNI